MDFKDVLLNICIHFLDIAQKNKSTDSVLLYLR